jgi:hypothetical protein
MERRAARRTRPEPGQLREKLDQALDFGAGGGAGHAINPARRKERTSLPLRIR